jgi:hypothetical protein
MEKTVKFNQRSLKCLRNQIKKLNLKSRLVYSLQMKRMRVRLKLLKKKRIYNSIKNQYLKTSDKNQLLNFNIILMISRLIDSKKSWLISLARNRNFKGL